jgi:Na+/phosphate symporter
MQKLPDNELKKEFESPRNRLRFGLMGLAFLTLGAVMLLVILFDPLGWLAGTPPAHEAKKWIAMSICFVLVPALAGIWFMIIRPFQTGVITSSSKYQAPHVILRSEDPSGFKPRLDGTVCW